MPRLPPWPANGAPRPPSCARPSSQTTTPAPTRWSSTPSTGWPNRAVEAIWPENIFRRSQDLEEAFHDAGQFYWGTVDAYLTDEVVFSPASVPIVLPRHLVQDIDTFEDWRRAELMFRVIQEEQAAATS